MIRMDQPRDDTEVPPPLLTLPSDKVEQAPSPPPSPVVIEVDREMGSSGNSGILMFIDIVQTQIFVREA